MSEIKLPVRYDRLEIRDSDDLRIAEVYGIPSHSDLTIGERRERRTAIGNQIATSLNAMPELVEAAKAVLNVFDPFNTGSTMIGEKELNRLRAAVEGGDDEKSQN